MVATSPYSDARSDEFDESEHPRDESGKFTDGGGSGGGLAPTARARTTGNKSWQASLDKSQAANHKALARLVESPRHFEGARAHFEVAVEHRGLAPIRYVEEKTKNVRVDGRLTRVSGTHNMNNGGIVLSKPVAEKLQAFAQRWTKDPEWERDRNALIPELLKSDDILAREGAEKLADEMRGVHTMVHETVHGYGPIKLDDLKGSGIVIEEVTTEVVSRVLVRDDYGYDTDAAQAAAPFKINVGYQPHIDNTVKALINTYAMTKTDAKALLEDAAIAFRQIPQGHYGWRPIDLFAKVVDSVYNHGSDNVDPTKATDRAKDLNVEFQRKWSKWLAA